MPQNGFIGFVPTFFLGLFPRFFGRRFFLFRFSSGNKTPRTLDLLFFFSGFSQGFARVFDGFLKGFTGRSWKKVTLVSQLYSLFWKKAAGYRFC